MDGIMNRNGTRIDPGRSKIGRYQPLLSRKTQSSSRTSPQSIFLACLTANPAFIAKWENNSKDMKFRQ